MSIYNEIVNFLSIVSECHSKSRKKTRIFSSSDLFRIQNNKTSGNDFTFRNNLKELQRQHEDTKVELSHVADVKDDCLKTIHDLNEQLRLADEKKRDARIESEKLAEECKEKDTMLNEVAAEMETLKALIGQLEVSKFKKKN